MKRLAFPSLLIGALLTAACAGADQPAATAEQLRRLATEAARAGNLPQAIQQATQAIEAAAKDPAGYTLRAGLYAAAEDHRRAIADYDRLLALDPRQADAYDQRGSQHFMLGQIAESIADFDRYLQLKPEQEPHHWKRGISYYYAGRFDEGQRQFEGYQTVDDNDVENAVWRYLCMARRDGVERARAELLAIKQDPRVGMMDVYALYAGRAKPDDVLAAARSGSPTGAELNARLFYAHLYLGLYFEAAGDAGRARQHIDTAAQQHKIGHYMWNVADVHSRRLRPVDGKP